MALKDVADKKVVGPMFTNAEELVRVQYNFADDGGAETDEYTLLEAGDDVVITEFYLRGIVELDSAADGASIDVGVDGGTEDILLDGIAEATVAADALVQPTIVEGTPNVLPMPLKLASAGKIKMKILTEALTSGQCEFVFRVCKFK